MASQRIGETGLSESGPSSHHVPYGVLHGINTSSSALINQGSAFDFGELEEAIVLQGIKIRNDEAKASALFTGRPSATLEMFPSWPMRFQQTSRRKGAGYTSEKPLDAKTLRRLAQNREAARKSRLRKKAYVQQLESSRLKLTHLEQDLQRARSQGVFMGCGGAGGSISSDSEAQWI
ncbi:Transcription factor TGA9 [Glycine soja]|uniref:Transcription factor TGA9 n=1 Tax=Glycine soja TaxID=3848 RepID=A0A445I563_GLYSO|nr:Transcription factor TGA9 [Glycine soja]